MVVIPLATRRRLGFDEARSWVVVTEVNNFVWPGPDLRPLPQDGNRFDYGLLPPSLFRRIRDQMMVHGAAAQVQFVPRTE